LFLFFFLARVAFIRPFLLSKLLIFIAYFELKYNIVTLCNCWMMNDHFTLKPISVFKPRNVYSSRHKSHDTKWKILRSAIKRKKDNLRLSLIVYTLYDAQEGLHKILSKFSPFAITPGRVLSMQTGFVNFVLWVMSKLLKLKTFFTKIVYFQPSLCARQYVQCEKLERVWIRCWVRIRKSICTTSHVSNYFKYINENQCRNTFWWIQP